MNEETRQRAIRLLGLGVRSRGAVVGLEQVREAAKKGKLAFAAVAPDVSQNSLDKLVPLLQAKRIRFTQDIPAAALGAVAGRATTAAIGVTDRNLAKGLRDLIWPRGGRTESGPDQEQ